MKSKHVVQLLEQAIERERDFVLSCRMCQQRDNPQVVESRLRAEGALEGMEIVLRALKFDDAVDLRTKAGF
jgi:hypothetical protein